MPLVAPVVDCSACLHYTRRWIIRAPDIAEMEELRERVNGCFEAAATSTGCTAEIEWNRVDAAIPEGHVSQPYTNVETNSAIAEAWRANMAVLGTTYQPREVEATMATGSTDMGNVSHVVPSIHPMFGRLCRCSCRYSDAT